MPTAEDAVRAALARHGATLRAVKPLHGGACQDNFKVELELEGRPLTLALRSDARASLPGSLGRRDEFRVVEAAVQAGVPTPAARWLEPSLLRDGAWAYFLDWAEGEAIGRRVVRNPELAQARATLPEVLGGVLAKLHAVTPERAPGLGLPLPEGGPAQAALAAARRLLDDVPSPQPACALVLRWLAERAPTDPVVLVHGDFRTGNFLVTPAGLSAVLDWEFAHWGSPYEDLAWLTVRDWRFGRIDLPVGGFGRREDLYRAYARASGRAVDPSRALWWEVMGNLRWALGSLYQGERYLKGETDLELIAIARRSTEMEFEALRLIRRGTLEEA